MSICDWITSLSNRYAVADLAILLSTLSTSQSEGVTPSYSQWTIETKAWGDGRRGSTKETRPEADPVLSPQLHPCIMGEDFFCDDSNSNGVSLVAMGTLYGCVYNTVRSHPCILCEKLTHLWYGNGHQWMCWWHCMGMLVGLPRCMVQNEGQ